MENCVRVKGVYVPQRGNCREVSYKGVVSESADVKSSKNGWQAKTSFENTEMGVKNRHCRVWIFVLFEMWTDTVAVGYSW